MNKKHKFWKQGSFVLRVALFLTALFFVLPLHASTLYASENGFAYPNISINFGTSSPGVGEADTDAQGVDSQGTSASLQVLFLTVLIALLPSLLVVMTCFTRIIIVFSFLRSALGTQQMPPNQVLIGLAVFITIFLMNPTIKIINETAFMPLSAGQIVPGEAVDKAMLPLREFMFRQAKDGDLELFADLAGQTYESRTDMYANMPNTQLIPAFIVGEITIGFQIGVLIYIPFIVIDMVVASTLMAMGMMMLPPAMISLPFKILLFVMVDGWNLVIENMIRTFR